MVGFITERELDQAEQEFPGIARFFASLNEKPRTFLDLMSLFENRRAIACVSVLTPPLTAR